MSCSKTWKIDGKCVVPHALEYREVRGLLAGLETQAKEQRAEIDQRIGALEPLLPELMYKAIREQVDEVRPLHAEIDDVLEELSRREPARQRDELLQLYRNGRLADRLQNDRTVQGVLATL